MGCLTKILRTVLIILLVIAGVGLVVIGLLNFELFTSLAGKLLIVVVIVGVIFVIAGSFLRLFK